MVMAKLHLICGNCGCSEEFTWEHSIDDEGPHLFLRCKNCNTLHDLNDNAKMEEVESDICLLPVQLPEPSKPVTAIIKHPEKWDTHVVDMVAVDEDDCNWRFSSDNCELAHGWSVVYWEYKD